MMIDKYSRTILAGIIAAPKTKPPSRQTVQAFRKANPKKATLRDVSTAFKAKLDAVRAFSKQIAPLTMDEMWKKYKDACERFTIIDKRAAAFTSKLGASEPKLVKQESIADLLKRFNVMRLKAKVPVIKASHKTHAELTNAIALFQHDHVATKYMERTVLPAASAEGAYKSTGEAIVATGHTERGLHKATVKRRKKLERHVYGKQAQPGATSKKTSHGAPNRSQARDGEVSLADVARELNIDPRIARAKARRNTSSLPPVASGSWNFAIADKAKLVKFLEAK